MMPPLISRYSANITDTSSSDAQDGWKEIIPLHKRLYHLPRLLSSLSKLKLSSLVVATTMVGFQLSPLAYNTSLLGWTALGVGLSSFAANGFNQWLESPMDSQMGRTRTRPLPTNQLSPFLVFHFGLAAGVMGVGILALKIGWMAAVLSGVNILLYASVYTPMKRMGIVNTWIGAVVGAIPPMIGYVGGGGNPDLTCFTLGALLYCWQFPHFNSLSWNLKNDYSRAGYCMASILNPKLTLDSALRHSIATIPLSLLLVYSGICSEWLAVDSTLVNSVLIFLAYQFRRDPSRKTARKLFLYTLIHLPLLLLVIILHRKRRAGLRPDVE